MGAALLYESPFTDIAPTTWLAQMYLDSGSLLSPSR
jgi:hypothetical protein